MDPEAVIPENAAVIRLRTYVFTSEKHPRYLAVFGHKKSGPGKVWMVPEVGGCFGYGSTGARRGDWIHILREVGIALMTK
jgi:hypothetical protein